MLTRGVEMAVVEYHFPATTAEAGVPPRPGGEVAVRRPAPLTGAPAPRPAVYRAPSTRLDRPSPAHRPPRPLRPEAAPRPAAVRPAAAARPSAAARPPDAVRPPAAVRPTRAPDPVPVPVRYRPAPAPAVRPPVAPAAEYLEAVGYPVLVPVVLVPVIPVRVHVTITFGF
ncbi:hypothetical protein GCM10009539_65490 [Cryptosporangium japonicum]|uniref:Uncharacterized protein n=1 Tax=Cryptosporangium japonicum TaxID=80872 RepID=A0ABP3EPE3_9ACTN